MAARVGNDHPQLGGGFRLRPGEIENAAECVQRYWQARWLAMICTQSSPLQFFSDEASQFKWRELQASDALLPGRRTYEGFAAAWPTMEGGEFGDKMNSMPKYVVSSTLENAGWTGSIFVRGNLATEIGKLKDRPGQDLLLSGSGQLSARGWPGLAALIDAGPAQATASRPASPELPFWSY